MPENKDHLSEMVIDLDAKVMILESQMSRLRSSMRAFLGDGLAEAQERDDRIDKLAESMDVHPCVTPGCDSLVAYDDEPRCFEHSPDSGSSVPGYSYRADQAEFEKHADQAIAVVADDTASIDRIH